MTPLVSSSPRVRENAAQNDTDNLRNLATQLFLAVLECRHHLGVISPDTGRVQPVRRLQTNRYRPEPAELSVPSRRRRRLSETSEFYRIFNIVNDLVDIISEIDANNSKDPVDVIRGSTHSISVRS